MLRYLMSGRLMPRLMPGASSFLAVWFMVWLLGAYVAPVLRASPAQQVVDRIVVRIEDDIITLSEMRELAGYQELVDGKAEPDDQLISELIEQWAVNTEATAAEFPPAAESEVDREVASIESHFSGSQVSPSQTPPPAYLQRLAELQLTPDAVRRMVAREIFLARYLDYKFRPAVQVEDSAIEAYYRDELIPELAAKKQMPPPLDEVREQIREVLVQRGISERASTWFEETKSRLNIEIEPLAGTATGTAAGSTSATAPASHAQ